MSKVKNKLELGKDITEEDLTFTTEQQEKIAKLRRDKENDFSYVSKGDNTYHDKLVEGAPCRFTTEGHTFIGHIKKVYKEDRILYYDIDTPIGLVKKIYSGNVCYRKVDTYTYNEDYINKDLYKMTTQKLLNELKKTRLIENSEDDYSFIYIYPSWMIKAVLKSRPHVKTKSEQKAIIQHHLSVNKQRRIKRKKAKN